jgi:hypothetical protein
MGDSSGRAGGCGLNPERKRGNGGDEAKKKKKGRKAN